MTLLGIPFQRSGLTSVAVLSAATSQWLTATHNKHGPMIPCTEKAICDSSLFAAPTRSGIDAVASGHGRGAATTPHTGVPATLSAPSRPLAPLTVTGAVHRHQHAQYPAAAGRDLYRQNRNGSLTLSPSLAMDDTSLPPLRQLLGPWFARRRALRKWTRRGTPPRARPPPTSPPNAAATRAPTGKICWIFSFFGPGIPEKAGSGGLEVHFGRKQRPFD